MKVFPKNPRYGKVLIQVGLYLMVLLYLVAGINHFINPEGYLRLIPPYIPEHELMNLLAGVFEVVFALGLLFPQTRKLAAWGIILMLIAFIPAHIYFIELDSCIPDGLCVSEWVGWFRLIIIHPFLLWWAWIFTK